MREREKTSASEYVSFAKKFAKPNLKVKAGNTNFRIFVCFLLTCEELDFYVMTFYCIRSRELVHTK